MTDVPFAAAGFAGASAAQEIQRASASVGAPNPSWRDQWPHRLQGA